MSLNDAVAQRLAMIAKLQDLLGFDRFRAISNERASRAVEGLSVDVAELAKDKKRLLDIDGIGPKIADKIIEFVETGRMSELDELSQQVPAGVVKMMEIPGLGPKTASLLWKTKGIDSVSRLKQAIEQGELLDVPRLGEKSIARLKESIELVEQGQKRVPLGIALPIAEEFVRAMERVPHVKRAAYAGSLRRGKDTIGDIDILVCVDDLAHAGPVAEAFRAQPRVNHVLVAGDTRSSVRAAIRNPHGAVSADADIRTKGGEVEDVAGHSIQVDLRLLPIESWGAALMYFTGSKEHNIRLRERALKRGCTLTDYGLFPEGEAPAKDTAAEPKSSKGKGSAKANPKAATKAAPAKKADDRPPHERGVKPIAGKTEEEVYHALGLPYIPPEIREDRSELDLTETPRLIELGDIQAELHAHTTASDGELSIEELAREAHRRGFHTIAVTDHSKSSAIAGGLTVDRLLEHIEAVHAARAKVKGIHILAGSEVDILADGTLDYDGKTLAKLDIVVASPHTALKQDPEAATKRLLKAISNPHVHILGHPTGRLVNRRAGLSPDMGQIVRAAAEHRVALEINAHWMRLDLRDTHTKAAIDAGCLIAIDCDVHAREDFDNLRYGVLTARRGWVTPERCVNAWDQAKLLAFLKSKR